MTDKATNTHDINEDPIEVLNVTETMLAQYVKAEIDVQIATAKAFPRSIGQFKKRALSMATVSEDVAASCEFSLPRREKNKQTGQYEIKYILGPSIRLAEIVVSAFQNTRSGARVVDNDGRTITAQGICHDLENNTVITMEVKRRITDSTGRTYSEDMQVVTGNAACAIALRNAIFKVIPMALIQDVYEEVKKVAIGDAETLVKRRFKAMEYFTTQKLGDVLITEQKVLELMGLKSIEDINLENLAVLSGMRSAVRNGESTLAELFATKEPDKAADHAKTTKALDQTKNLINQKKARR